MLRYEWIHLQSFVSSNVYTEPVEEHGIQLVPFGFYSFTNQLLNRYLRGLILTTAVNVFYCYLELIQVKSRLHKHNLVWFDLAIWFWNIIIMYLIVGLQPYKHSLYILTCFGSEWTALKQTFAQICLKCFVQVYHSFESETVWIFA